MAASRKLSDTVINRHAAKDALFTADDGTPAAWAYRHIDANGQRRIFASLLHGTMANGMPGAIGLQKAEPGRQVVCMAGDGGISMLFGDLMTSVAQELPIKIAVYDNGIARLCGDRAQGRRDARHLHEVEKIRILQGLPAAVRFLGRNGLKRGTVGDRGQELAGATRARTSACARQSDAARDAAVHAGRAGDRNGALFDPRYPAWPGRRRLGNGEREFPLNEVLVTPGRAGSGLAGLLREEMPRAATSVH